MGRDKATLRVGRETLVERAVTRLAAVCDRVVVADRDRGVAPRGVTAVADGPGAGPAAGILGAAASAPEADLLVLGCDLPAVPVALLEHLRDTAGDWVVPFRGGWPEPLVALYRRPALAALRRRVLAGVFDLRGLAAEPDVAVVAVSGARLAAFGAPRHSLVNLNRPEDVERYLRLRRPR